MRRDTSLPTEYLLLFQLLGFPEGLRLGLLLLSFNLGSRLVHLLLVAEEDLHEDDVGAEDAYVESKVTNRDNRLLRLEGYVLFEELAMSQKYGNSGRI